MVSYDQLFPHQVSVVKHMKNNFGAIVYHSTGSGKTITALLSMCQFNRRIIIIGNKSSQKAFNDEAKNLDNCIIRFVTLSMITRIILIEPNFLQNACVIVDEAHNLRNYTKNNRIIWKSLWVAHRILFLTATLLVNHVCDLFVLLNIINKNNNLPTRKIEYERNKKDIDFKREISNKISYYKAGKNGYPLSKEIIKYVKYDRSQIIEYKKYIRKIFKDSNNRVLPEDLDIGSKWIKKYNEKDSIYELDESIKENSFLCAVRQISNTMNGLVDYPKIRKVFKIVKNDIALKSYPIVIYSSFLKNGIIPIKRLLDEMGISNSLVTGDQTSKQIKEAVDDYNNNRIKVLFVSAAGSESLNLKNTRSIHILEPFWNNARITQVIGRAIRYESHVSLPKNEQIVVIYKWISKFDNVKYKHLSADELLLKISKIKEDEYKKFNKIIIQNSI